jgi:chromatin segregation and condensation protein Rec8/ScpA/Scc1 (kleisin family)
MRLRLPMMPLRRRSGLWNSTFVVSLGLARRGDVTLGQEDRFQDIYIAPI